MTEQMQTLISQTPSKVTAPVAENPYGFDIDPEAMAEFGIPFND